MTPTAIALGNFDGVHLGHQAVIRQVLPDGASPARVAPLSPSTWDHDALAAPRSCHTPGPPTVPLRGLSHRLALSPDQVDLDLGPAAPFRSSSPTPIPTVLTFFPHPQEFFSGQSRPLLTPLAEKAAHISRLGIGQLVLLPFNQKLAHLSPQEFVETLLVKQLRAQRISVGKDFCFGKNRQGSVEDLRALAQPYGIEVEIAPLISLGEDRISSSRIRTALTQADLATAGALLGRPYALTGRVVQGQQLGRKLGFPTANLSLPADKFLPCEGVYSVWVQGAPPLPDQSLPGVMNLGLRPTVNGLTPTVEVHLLHWSGDLYGQTLQVLLHRYLRPQQKFEGLEQLRGQIQRDCQTALALLSRAPVGNFY